uniref:CLOCK-interacting pacemaker b n=1 Tax=Amphilophus citrinellus TaxID=61819 RepID=A0A3Q0T151_AMPCI
MPKEQPSLDEHSPHSTLSKNAKDKSNNTALLAIRDTTGADDSSRRGSHCSSEKDSGFSGEALLYSIQVSAGIGMFISAMHLLWKNSSKGISHSGSPQMILFQQPGLLPATFQLPKPSSRKFNVAGQKIPGSYLPILNSYPRIAPHPSKKSPDKFSSIHESQNLNKRACTEQKSEDPAVTKGLPERHLHKQPKLAVSAAGMPCSSPPRDRLSASSPTTASMSQRSPSESSQDTSYSLFTTSSVGLHRHATASIRHRRFLNTVKILRQSGLLDITLRTKELMRQSNAIQRDLTQLRQHTELLCQAASNRSINLNGVTVWEHLYRAMAESGSYPNLKVLQNFQTSSWPDSASPPESISKGDTNGPQAVAQQQRQSKQDGKLKAGETSTDRVSFTPPDSSTG